MSSLNIEYNGKTIPIANVGIVSSKEKVIFGSLERDLLLQTLGSVLILVGNKFYELPFNTDGSWAGGNLNIKDIDGLDNLDLSLYSNGTFLYDTKGNVLYLIHNKTLITISGSDDDNQIFLSYINEQTLTGALKQRLVLNAGQFLNSILDVKRLTFEDVYDGMIVFVNDEKVHYLLTNSRYPNEISSWETFYIGSLGGIIKNGLIIKNQTRANLLYLNEIDPMQSNIFNGLKIGSDEKWIKTSVNILDLSLIDYNTKEFLIKNQSFKLFHVVNNNIGIRGDASGSDDYNIIAHGSLKMNGPFFTDKKMVSTDFNTINITHWDGGRGFGLTRGSDSKWNLEIDNLIVRDSLVANKMVLKSLEVERAYATGGHILVTDGAVINSYNYRKPTAEELQTANITYNGNHGTLEADSYYYFVTFKESTEKDDNDAYVSLPTTPAFPSENNLTDNIEKDTLDVDKNCPFIAGDVLLCQTASGLTAKRYYAYVSYSTNKYIAIKSNHLRNNVIYLRDNEGNPVSIFKDFSIEANDSLIRITNLLTDNEGVYKNKNRRRFIDIDGTRNQITMYDNLGNPNLFSGAPNADGFYDDIEIITGIGQNGSLRLRMGELSDLGINGITGYGLYCDNVLLKGKLIVKDPSGEYPIGATKGVWIPGNTNTYYLNDIISYNGSAYRCVVQHTNTAELLAIPGISDFWEIWVQKGNDGVAGTSFKYVDISGELVFVYDQELDSFDKVNIPLSCTAFNIDYANLVNIKFDWSIGGTTIKSRTYLKAEVLSGTIIDSINIYPRGINETINWDNYWVDNKSISVTCKVYTNDSLIYDSDVFSVYKVKNGEDSYSVLLSNEAMTVPCLPDGSFPSNIFDSPYKYQTELLVYNGITKLIYGLDYFITFTNGLISLVNSSTIGQDHGLLSVSGFSTADLTINHGSINITVNILRNSVIFLSFIKTISISKAQQGPLLDWIKEWDQNSTIVGADKIISPRIFTGTNDVNGITGVTLGRNAFGLTEVGVGGYYHSQPTFSLNTNGEIIIGAKNNSITYLTTTYNAGTNYLSFSLANGLEISADVKFKDPNGSYTLQGYVANNTPIIYRDAYTTSINKSTFAPTGVKNKDLWYPLSYDSGSITYNGYFFIYDSTLVGDKWVIAGDNTITTINGGIITSGTIQLGSSGTTNSGVTGLTDVGDTNPVRFWAGDTFANRNIADFKVHENGLLEIGNTNASYTLDGNGLLTTGTGLILYTDPTTHSGGLSTKKLGIKPDGSVYIDGSVLVSNIAGSSENIALSQLLSYFVLKTVEGVNFLSTTYPIVSEKEIIAYGSSILPGEGGGGTVGSLGGLANVGLWADDVPASDRIMVQLAGATHWSSKLLSEIVGLDTVALGAYLVANSYAKQSYVDARVAELVGTAPATLDTLNELAAALGNDPNFATSMSTLIGTKWTQDNTKIANWDSAYSHISDSVKHITGTERTNWNSAYSALHSHTNKTVLDGVTSELITNWNTAFTNNHTHPNKSIIDSLTQANLDVLSKLSIVDGNLKVDTNLWSTGEVSAYGAGSGTGGGGTGLITSVLGSTGLGGSYLDSDLTNTFNAYTINLINNNLTSALGRIGALETSTPNVSWETPTAQYSPLTINSVTRNLSVDGHTHSYLPLSGGQLTGQLSLLQGASGGISFPDNSFGGGGDSASIRLLNPVGGESTEMTFTMTNDADDIINFSVPSIDGVKINRYTVWNAGNFTNLTQLTTRNFIDLQNKPTTLSGYGITDSIARDDRGIGNIIANNINYSVYGFGYSSDGFPTSGSFISFGGLNNRYVTQIQGSYGGAGMYYRTRNDDNGTWNSWHTILDDVNAYTKTLADNTFLKLAGGTLTGSVFLPLDKPALRFGNARAWDSAIAHDTASYEVEAFMSKYAGSKYRFKVGFDPTGFTSGSFVNMTDADLEIGAGYCKINNNTVWHAGNDGAGSGLDADLLDGVNSSGYASASQYPSTSTNNFSIKSGIYSTQDGTTDLPTNGVGNSIVHCNWDVNAANQLFLQYNSDYVAFRRKAGNVWQAWKQFAFTTDNVASATKLANKRTIWGQNFDGTGNITGDLTLSGNLNFNTSANQINSTSAVELALNYAGGGARHTSIFNGQGGFVMRVHANGNVGIGTLEPQYKLDVNGASRIFGGLHLNSEGWLNLYNAANTSTISLSHNSESSKLDIFNRTLGNWANVEAGFLTCDTITMKNNLSEKFIRSNAWGGAIRLRGNSGAATDRGLQLGRVDNNLSFTSFMAFNGDSGNVSIGTTTDAGVKLYVVGNIVATGEVTAYSASDRRLKTEVTTLKDSLRIIELLNPVSYKWNSLAKELNPLKNDNTDYGLIAQELDVVMPELVHTIYGQYKSVDYVKLIPHLICAIKQLKMEIDHLKKTYY